MLHVRQMRKEKNSHSSDEYQSLSFDFAYYKSKQLALKVFMNTFYGQAGDQTSPLFMLALAGGVTTAGQDNIKKVIAHLRSLDCDVVYGDTDSAYIICPRNTYSDINVQYYSGQMSKLDYWTALVEKTFVAIDIINKSVNDMLFDDNGTRFLQTAYEEVLYPTLLAAKKKYGGIPHENIVNFQPKELFIRGFELKKRGVSELLREICLDILWKSMSMTELRPLRHIVEDAIDIIYTRKWDFHYFIRTASYKPNKQNVAVHKFVERMKKERDITIKPVERFKYVYVKKFPTRWEIDGTQVKTIKLMAGDLMELSSVAEEEAMEIDLDKYVAGSIEGQFARFIVYHKDFAYLRGTSADEEAQYYENAKAHIKSLRMAYADKHANYGKFYRSAVKTVDKIVDSKIRHVSNEATIALNRLTGPLDEVIAEIEEEVRNDEFIKESDLEYAKGFIMRRKREMTINEINKHYVGRTTISGMVKQRGIIDLRIKDINKKIHELKAQINKSIAENPEMYSMQSGIIEQVIKTVRDETVHQDGDEDTILATLEEKFNSSKDAIIDSVIDKKLELIRLHKDDLIEMNHILERIDIHYRLLVRSERLRNRIRDAVYSDGKIVQLPTGISGKSIVEKTMMSIKDSMDDVKVY